jgi:hypothetical protein
VTTLTAQGISANLPAGWEGRVFRRPSSGEVAATEADGPPAPPGETTNAVAHFATIALPPGVGDFASSAVDRLRRDDALIVLFEYDPASITQPLFATTGMPRRLDPDAFNPNVLQRALRGQAGLQAFFNEAGRAFTLYVVLGSHANRASVVPTVNGVLSSVVISARPDTSGATTGSTTTSTTTSTSTTTTTTVAPNAQPSPTTTTEPQGKP